jgi:hypothetical protein
VPRVNLLSKLPTQLKWKPFVAALKALKYEQLPSKGGSARHFQRGTEDPITFHEPHGGDTLKQGTLTEYLRKLDIDRAAFEKALSGSRSFDIDAEEERYRRTMLSNGSIVSNCLSCLNVVIESFLEEEVDAAEATHSCP